MPREKKYTRTVAFRVTAEEWELIQQDMAYKGHKKASDWVREELSPLFEVIRWAKAQDAKKAEAAAKRAAKKAATNVDA